MTRCVLLFFIERLCKHRAKFLPLSHVSRAGLTAETLLVLPGLRCSLLARWGVGGGGRARPRREGRACSGRWTVDRRWSVDGGGGACAVRGGRGTRTRLAFYIFFDAFFPAFIRFHLPLHVWLSSRAHISSTALLLYGTVYSQPAVKTLKAVWAVGSLARRDARAVVLTLYFSMSSCFIACFMWGQRGVCTLGSVA